MFWRIATAVAVFVIAAIVFGLLGGFLAGFKEESLKLVGTFLAGNSLVLGFLVGLAQFIWGKPYNRPQ